MSFDDLPLLRASGFDDAADEIVRLRLELEAARRETSAVAGLAHNLMTVRSEPPGDALTLLRGIVDNCQTVRTPNIGSRMDPVNSLYLVSARRVEAAREYLSTAETTPVVRCICGEGSYASTDQCPVHAGATEGGQ